MLTDKRPLYVYIRLRYSPYLFQVELYYSEKIHKLHSDYPLAPEKMNIYEEMLSPFQSKFSKHTKLQSQKLTPNLNDKRKYVVHYQNLKFYI